MYKIESRLSDEVLMDLEENYELSFEEICTIENYANKILREERLLSFIDDGSYERFITRCVTQIISPTSESEIIINKETAEIVLFCYEWVLEERDSDLDNYSHSDLDFEAHDYRSRNNKNMNIQQECKETYLNVDSEIAKLQRTREIINRRKDIN